MIYRLIMIVYTLVASIGLVYGQQSVNDLVFDKASLNAFETRKEWLISQGVITKDISPSYINELIHADSPYLLSHALQPIDWVPWVNAFEQGHIDKSKLIFISIGYSTCHWCHVMAQETFSDPMIGQELNLNYISVKVDREQWPLVDNRFKTALEVLKGEAGWPINVVLTPDGDIIWIDSYLSKAKFNKIITSLSKRWKQSTQTVLAVSERIEHELYKNSFQVGKDKINRASFAQLKEELPKQHELILNLLQKESTQSGPRFLRANWSLGLLDEYLRTGNEKYLDIVESQVRSILLSPTYDSIEGGFHRYAVDGNWQQPHYEKMLYTQANMIRVLSRLYAITAKKEYFTALEQTNNWVEKWLKQQYGYASAVSALSGGVEGAYYQLPQGIIKRDSKSKEYFGYDTIQLVAPNSSLIFLKKLPDDWRTLNFVSEVQSYRQIASKPLVDEKVLVSWNALYAIALLDAFTVTHDKKFYTQALLLINHLWDNFYIGEQLYRSEFLGKVSIEAQFDDYALLAIALLKLSFYESWSESRKASSFQVRANTLLMDLQIILNSKTKFKALMDLNHDSELASIKSDVYQAFAEGYKLLKEPSYNKLSRRISSFDKEQLHLLVNEYTLSNQLSAKVKQINVGQTFFANGHGKVIVTQDENSIIANIDLEPGWHINADSVIDERYHATQVTVENIAEFNKVFTRVTYPKAKLQSLSFSKNPLKLFEGNFDIKMNTNSLKSNNKHNVIINLQSCSDKLCLLPETLNLYPTTSL
ncbi:thioredoxin domain-containing protein [Shewanella goraebulensis]|uniref:thioredoxin domain-containing protein n=1 Tax=Shewanella goraebulensis TaxID=3050637 RepID=UPI00254E425F|nr:DUF255 domain-containing protein [Shewanella goraebulensis]